MQQLPLRSCSQRIAPKDCYLQLSTSNFAQQAVRSGFRALIRCRLASPSLALLKLRVAPAVLDDEGQGTTLGSPRACWEA